MNIFLKRKKITNYFLQLKYFKIKYLRNNSIILGCFSFPKNKRGKRTIEWKGTIIFTEKRGYSLKKYLKELYNKTRNTSIYDYLDELIYTFKLSGKTIKFEKGLIKLLESIKLKVIKGKGAKKYLDVIDSKGDVRLRGTKDEIEKYVKKITQGEKKLLDDLNAIIKRSLKSSQAFDPLKDALKPLRDAGVNIQKSVRGLVPDFAKTPKFLYKGDIKYGKIKIKLTGVDAKDFQQAFLKAGITNKKLIKKIKSEYTWHHMDDFNPKTGECTMQLVKTKIHEKTCPHKGGAGLWSDLFEIIYKNRKK